VAWRQYALTLLHRFTPRGEVYFTQARRIGQTTSTATLPRLHAINLVNVRGEINGSGTGDRTPNGIGVDW
jgi:hypothetical protein